MLNEKRSYDMQGKSPQELLVASRIFNEVDCSFSSHPKGNI